MRCGCWMRCCGGSIGRSGRGIIRGGVGSRRETRNGVVLRRYVSASCEGCPLVARCLSHAKAATPVQRAAANGRVRSLRRDEHEEVRQRTATRMATDSARELFNRRSAIAETPFAYLKAVLGLRHFLHRGLEKVDHVWRWSCLSLNVQKLLRALSHWHTLARQALAAESPASLATTGA